MFLNKNNRSLKKKDHFVALLWPPFAKFNVNQETRDMKKCLAIIFLLCSTPLLAQTITASADTVICPPECADLSATYVLAGGGSTLSYTESVIPYAPDPFAGTSVSLWDDSQTGLLPIGFDFCFYGDTYNQFVICSNNWIGFSTGMTSTWVTSTVPSTAANRPKNCIMGPWQDINPGIGGSIKYQTLGAAPFRRLVVTYQNVPMYSCTAMTFAAQIIIYESTGVIENHIQAKPICPTWNSGNAVQSLHNLAGTVADIIPGRNNTNWSVSNEAQRWTPDGPPLIEWYDGPTLIGTGTTISVCPLVTTTYTVQITGCDGTALASDDVTVMVSCCDTPPTDSLDVTCNGACDGKVWATGDGLAPFTFLWDDPGASTTDTVSGLCPGTYLVTVTDATGCVATNTIEVVEPPVLTIAVDGTTDESCDLLNGEIVVSGAGGVPPYQFSNDGGVTFSGSGTFSGLDGGTYSMVVEDANGCQATVSVTIAGPPAVTVTETIVNETCEGDCNGAIDLVASAGPTPYVYSITGGASTSGSGTFVSLCPDDYDIVVTDANGCVYINTVTVVGGPPVGDATITPVEPFCVSDDPYNMVCAMLGGTWSGAGIDPASGLFDPAAAGPGTHTITYTISGPCGDTDSRDVVVYDLPEVNPVGVETQGCEPLNVVFSNAGTGTGNCYWTFGDGSTMNACGVIAHEYLFAGVYDVNLTITDANGCTDSMKLIDYITVYDMPVASFSWTPNEVDIMDPTVNFIDHSLNATEWKWTFQGGLPVSDEQNPVITFPEIGEYLTLLEVTNEGGCRDSVIRLITINDVIIFFVPNVFTPDGDHYNETFKPQFTSGIDIYNFHFSIYNRWGEIVWESYNPEVGWDGTYADRGLIEDGTYVWRLEFMETMNEKEHEHHGHVTILK